MLVGNKYYKKREFGKGKWGVLAEGRVAILDCGVREGLTKELTFGESV